MDYEVHEPLVKLTIDEDAIEGDLCIPEGARGVVLFAHGAGSSRNSKRNNFIADELQREGLATLLIDLLITKEKRIDQQTREIRFDIDRLAKRVPGTVDWLDEYENTKSLMIGVFGSSAGAAGTLIAVARRPEKVKTAVSRDCGWERHPGPCLESTGNRENGDGYRTESHRRCRPFIWRTRRA